MADVDYIGPFEYHAVCVNGWRVPYLTATPMQGGKIHLTLDHRYGLDLTLKDAETVVPFIANAIAVASGYTCHPIETGESYKTPPTKRHPFNRMHGIDVGPGPT